MLVENLTTKLSYFSLVTTKRSQLSNQYFQKLEFDTIILYRKHNSTYYNNFIWIQELNPLLYFNVLQDCYVYYFNVPQTPDVQLGFGSQSTSQELPLMALQTLPLASENSDFKRQRSIEQEPKMDSSQRKFDQLKTTPRSTKKGKNVKQQKKTKKKQIYPYSMPNTKQYIEQYESYKYTEQQLQDLTHLNTSTILGHFFRPLNQFRDSELIMRTLVKLGIQNSELMEFYDWLKTFNIGASKSYRRSILFQIMNSEGRRDFKKALRIAYSHYLRSLSVNRILTAKATNDKDRYLLANRVLVLEMEQYFERSGGF